MQLELAISAATDSIEAALKRHFQDEILDGDNKYHCEGCKNKVRAVRGQRLEVAPNVLVVCLKRFDSGSYFFKNNKPVRYKELLDVGPYLATDSLDSPDTCLYQLHGVVMHLDFMNSTGSGHYVSHVCPEGKQWYQCNDSTVRQISKEKALDPRAYMLFYTRQTPHAAPRPMTAPPCKHPSGQEVNAHQLSNGSASDHHDSAGALGPQSHPIPETNTKQLSPSPCRTPSPTKPRGAAQSFDTTLHESSGDESASCQTTGVAQEAAEVSSRPLCGSISSVSESTDDSSYSSHLPYCVKEGTLGQPGVVKLLLNLGTEACRAQDVQVAISGTNHIVVHVSSRVPLDLHVGDGVVIDKLECSLVRKRNRLKIICTLTAADAADPEPETEAPQSAAPIPTRDTAASPLCHPTEPTPSPCASPSGTHHTPLPPVLDGSQQPSSSQHEPVRSRSQLDDASSEEDDISTLDQKRVLYDLLAELPTSLEATCPDDSEHDVADKDGWSWPASVGSECESLDLFRHPHPGSPVKNDHPASSCNSMLGAHPLSSATASESPYDSDQPSPAEDTPTAPQDTGAPVVGKKRRIKQQHCNSQPTAPLTLDIDTSSSQNNVPSKLGPPSTPVPPTPTRTAPLSGTSIEVSVDAGSKMQALLQDTDALSVSSDSDVSQEKSSDDSTGAPEAESTANGISKAAGSAKKVAAKKPKQKACKTKGKKKKARKH